jgi:hypothetical protein
MESDNEDLAEEATPGVVEASATVPRVWPKRGVCAAFGAPGVYPVRRPGGHEVTAEPAGSSSFKQQVDQRFGRLELKVESMLTSQAASSTDAKKRFGKIEQVVETLSSKHGSLEDMMRQMAGNTLDLQKTCSGLAVSFESLRKDLVRAVHPSPRLDEENGATRPRIA